MTRAEDVAVYDERGARWWDSAEFLLRGLRALVPARLREFERIAGPWRGRRVLDLGCGGGFMAEAIARAGGNVVGVDPAARAIAAARAHAATQGLDIRYEVGSAEAIPLADAAVERVVCVDVLEHVGDLEQCCREIARVLEPGGMLLFDTVNDTRFARALMIGMLERVMRVLPRGTHDPAKLVSPARLSRALAAAGLQPGRLIGLGPIGIDRRGAPIFGRWPWLGFLYLGAATRSHSRG